MISESLSSLEDDLNFNKNILTKNLLEPVDTLVEKQKSNLLFADNPLTALKSSKLSEADEILKSARNFRHARELFHALAVDEKKLVTSPDAHDATKTNTNNFMQSEKPEL